MIYIQQVWEREWGGRTYAGEGELVLDYVIGDEEV